MAYMQDYADRARSGWQSRWTAAMIDLRARMARHRLYRQTRHELAVLSDRELADLGLHRSEIGRIAWQAAYEM